MVVLRRLEVHGWRCLRVMVGLICLCCLRRCLRLVISVLFVSIRIILILMVNLRLVVFRARYR